MQFVREGRFIITCFLAPVWLVAQFSSFPFPPAMNRIAGCLICLLGATAWAMEGGHITLRIAAGVGMISNGIVIIINGGMPVAPFFGHAMKRTGLWLPYDPAIHHGFFLIDRIIGLSVGDLLILSALLLKAFLKY